MSFKAEADDFRRLFADAKRFDTELPKNLRRRLRVAAKPMAQAAKDAARAIPAKPPEDTGLRRAMARSVTVEVAAGKKKAGVFIKAKQSKMPRHQRTLLRAMQRGSWRHPVFGNRRVFVTQQGADWFDGPVAAKSPIGEKAIQEALWDTERAIGFK